MADWTPIDGRRAERLERGDEDLTPSEVAEGWHFCWDFDGMLVHPDSPEGACCNCVPAHPTHQG